MERIHDMIIIGAGPAGYTAALYAARAGRKPLVLERMSLGGQMAVTDKIDNYPGFEEGIDGFSLALKMQAGAERFGAETKYAEVLSVDFSGTPKKLQTSEGEYLARTVVIATGADPRPLGVNGEEKLVGKGVHYCAHCDGRFYKGKTVVVVGGGNTAVSDALYLSSLAERVILVHRRDTLRATAIYTDALMRTPNVTVLWDSVVTELLFDERLNGIKVQNLKNKAEQIVDCNAVFVSIGRMPATSLFREALATDASGYILADESTRTNVDGVFAVGDVRTKDLRQVVTAVADGAVAAHFAEEYLFMHPHP